MGGDPAGGRKIYDGDAVIAADHINAYLTPGEDIFIESRSRPLCPVPEMGIGNQPIDGGFYLFRDDEKEEFVRKEPAAEKYFRRWWGADEFINRRPRWCLWLGEADPVEIVRLPECLKRVEAVRNFRLSSSRPATVKVADKPTRFFIENMPESDYILVPRVSSERRAYTPMGFLSSDNLTSDSALLIPDATLYHFGVLTSCVHMAWMRAVCGRLKSDYRYSKDIVYNNFPWPAGITPEQEATVGLTAKAIIDTREKYPDASLAELYGNLTLFPELLNAHRANDAAVLAAYGFPKDISESETVSRLFALHRELQSISQVPR